MTGSTNRILGGFADPPPESLASSRHLRRLLYIVFGIAVAMLVQARQSAPTAGATSRIPLYLALIAVELTLVWFVAIGIRARGHTLRELFGRRWRTAFDGAGDLVLALATAWLLHSLGTSSFITFSVAGPPTPAFFFPRLCRNRSSGLPSRSPPALARNWCFAVTCNASFGA